MEQITINFTIEEIRTILTGLEMKMKADREHAIKETYGKPFKDSCDSFKTWMAEYRRTDLLHDKIIFACDK